MSPLGIRYLTAIEDWKAPYEVAAILGEGRTVKTVSATLFGLVGRGLAEHGRANNTFRVTDAGRVAMSPATRETPCQHAAIIGLDGMWHCQKCGDAIDMTVAHSSQQGKSP